MLVGLCDVLFLINTDGNIPALKPIKVFPQEDKLC